MEGSNVQDEAGIFRNLAAHVIPSVVIVEDTLNVNDDSYSAGCVIHKTKTDTFVLTKKKEVCQPGLVVHFSENRAKHAECLASDQFFAVLAIGEANETCKSITWKDPVDDSDALIFAPHSTSGYEKIKGYISKGSCECAAGDASPDSELEGSRDLFITLCHHRKTDNMVSTPVFSKTGEANGVVLTDCSSKDGEDGAAHKICLSATGVERALKLMTHEDNWQEALTNMGSQKAKRKQSLGQTKTRGEASRPKKKKARTS